MMGKDGDDGSGCLVCVAIGVTVWFFYTRVDEPILHFPYQFISQLGNTTNFSSLLYDIIFVFISCRFDLENVIGRADIIFSNKTRHVEGGKILPLRR